MHRLDIRLWTTYNTISWYTYVNDFLSHCRSHTVSLTYIISLSVLGMSMTHRFDIRLSMTHNTASWCTWVNDFLSHCLSHICHSFACIKRRCIIHANDDALTYARQREKWYMWERQCESDSVRESHSHKYIKIQYYKSLTGVYLIYVCHHWHTQDNISRPCGCVIQGGKDA